MVAERAFSKVRAGASNPIFLSAGYFWTCPNWHAAAHEIYETVMDLQYGRRAKLTCEP